MQLTLGPLLLALDVARAQYFFDLYMLAPLHALNDLSQYADLGLGPAEIVAPLLLQPQDLDGLAADQQCEDDVGRGGVPLTPTWMIGAALEGLGDHGPPEAGLENAWERQVARMHKRRRGQQRIVASVWPQRGEHDIAVAGGRAEQLADEGCGVHGGAKVQSMVES